MSPWRLWPPGVGCAHLRKLRLPLLKLLRRQDQGAKTDGRIRWGIQMRLTGELMFLLFAALFAAGNGGVGTARCAIGVGTDEI